MAKNNNNIEKQSAQVDVEENKRLDSTKIFLIVFAAVALVGILTSLVFALVPMFKKDKSLDYLKDDLSKYVSVPYELYNSYTVTVDLPLVGEKDVEYEILKLLCTHKESNDKSLENRVNRTIGAGDVANIYYRGYTLNDDGTKNYFDGSRHWWVAPSSPTVIPA